MEPLKIRLEGDTQVVVTRRFAAKPEAVFRAHTEAELIKQWMLGPDGWTMPECISEPFPGGKTKFVWANDSGESFSLTAETISIDPPHRIVHVERMHLPDPTPDNHVVTTFEADGDGTLMTMVMTLPNSEVREMMLSTGMDQGMEISYQRMERVVL